MTDVVHPDNAAIILQAVRVLDLDVVTLDIVAPDITESIWETGGAIIELNTRSGFRADLYPTVGQPRDPGPAIVEMLFPPGRPVRTPIFAVAGDLPAADVVSGLIERLLTETGATVGLVSTSGLLIAGRRIRAVESLVPSGVATLLNNPATEVVIAQVDAGQITEHGLGFTYCDLAVVLSLSGITTPFGKPVETLLIDSLGDDGMLVYNPADDATARCVEGRARLPVLFAIDSCDTIVRDHMACGGKAVILRRVSDGDTISLIEENVVTDLLPATTPAIAADLPESSSSLVLLAATAAGIAHGVPIETIRRALS